jgi:pseudouridine-5'-phosphate glycosidase
LGGRLKAGLTRDEIERLGRGGDESQKSAGATCRSWWHVAGTGATTVAATMIIAALAGIRVFATGGIGGSHRGAELSFNVSADLQELARTPVVVVCAGAKSILDIRLTLDWNPWCAGDRLPHGQPAHLLQSGRRFRRRCPT